MRLSLRFALYALVCALTAQTAIAQVATGTYPYGTYDTPGFDTINVGNLNVHFAIPVLNKAGRGMPFFYNLGYDSSVWIPSTSSSGSLSWTPVQAFGWKADTNVVTGYVTYKEVGTVLTKLNPTTHLYYTCTESTASLFTYHDPFGVSHSFSGSTLDTSTYNNPSGCNLPASQPSFSSVANDGTGLSLSITNYTYATLTTTSGRVVVPGQGGTGTVTDANGNEISVDPSGHFTDTTGKVVLTASGGAPNPEEFTYTDTSGNSQAVKMNYETYTVQTDFGCSGVAEYPATSTSLVSSFVFPDGSTYGFTYEQTPNGSGNVTGRIASVTLPQGGVISYTYTGSNNGIECSDGSAAGLTRSLSASQNSAASTWTYARTTGTGTSTTNVTDGLSNSKTYTFVEASNQPSGTTAEYYETSRTIKQGSSTTVLARNTCYNGAASPCTTSQFTLPISQIDTYETLNGSVTHGTTAKYNTYGAQTESDIYDFATGASRGPLLSKEVWTYGYTIPVLPTADAVYDGSGSLAGETTYAYDGSTPTTSSGVPQHLAVTGARGNLTTETLYASSGTSYLITNTYEDTGNLLTSTGPNGKTTYSWDPTFVYNTGVTQPTPSSGVTIATGASYDTSYTGLPLSSTDLNGQATQIPASDYDELLRPTQINYPDGGKTVMVYYNPYQTEVSNYQTSSNATSTQILVDGYARQSRVAVATGQSANPYYQTDSCYDGNGNLSFSSYRYIGQGWGTAKQCSGNGGDTYSYDVLGRVTGIAHGDGTGQSFTYNGRAVKSVDENRVTKISQVDGLGRPTIVCEVTSSSLLSGSNIESPTSCGTDISGTGFTTTYGYSLATGTTTVTQGVQTRTFVTDWLGRRNSATEPESGTTTYTYAYNSTGLVVTRTRPKANQPSASVTTTTTTQYDSLSRPLTVAYNDGITPNKNFNYDANPSGGWAGQNGANVKGRLVYMGAELGSNTTTWSGDLFSYDQMGRVKQIWECTPLTCGTAQQAERSVSYDYDFAGNITLESDTVSGAVSYGRSMANEVTSITNQTYTLAGGNGSTPLVSNVQNGPYGPLSYNLGNGLTDVKTYDGLGRQNGGYVCNGSSSVSCSGGTQVYGFATSWSGVRDTWDCDTDMNQCFLYGYDDFNRLASRTVNQGTTQNFTYTYDRYGNRWYQTLTAGSGPQPQYSFNIAKNQITTAGYSYDAAGNMTNDGSHSYTYDAEGKILTVDGGSTASYVYDAFDRKIHAATPGTTEFVYDMANHVTSNWYSATDGVEGHIFWDGRQIAYRSGNGQTYFEHRDWLQTDRIHTNATGSNVAQWTSLPFGDGGTMASSDSYATWDFAHFADMDVNGESGTYAAQYRQYNQTQGRWMRPDPYYGSYDLSNPQSLNRYAYVLNNPLSYIDPLGLNHDVTVLDGGCLYTYEEDVTFDGANQNVTEQLVDVDCEDNAGGSGGAAGTSGGSGGGGSASTNPLNPRQLDPNSQECQALANKIANISADIQSSTGDLATNPLGLPDAPPFPGAPRRMSVQGHQELLNEKIQNLANRAHEYNQKCGGGDPFGGGAAASVPNASPSANPLISPRVRGGLIVIGGAIIVGGTVILCPECLVFAPAFAF